jgi:hypothetical protein
VQHWRAYAGREGLAQACVRGFDFLPPPSMRMAGFQRFRTKDFHAHITFNDYVMMGF